jgi:hypothetical protein
MLAVTSREAHKTQFVNIAADGGLGDLDTAFGEVFGNFGLGRNKLALDEFFNEALTVLFTWHIYTLYKLACGYTSLGYTENLLTLAASVLNNTMPKAACTTCLHYFVQTRKCRRYKKHAYAVLE